MSTLPGWVAPAPWPRPLRLDPADAGRLSSWIHAGYPEETCGLLVGHERDEARVIVRAEAARNINRERARDRYLIDPRDQLRIEEAALRDGLDVLGVWHSHPDHPAVPSLTDDQRAWDGYSYLIIRVGPTGCEHWLCWRRADGLFHPQPFEVQTMSPITIRIPTPLRSLTGGAREVHASGATVGEVFEALFAEHAALKSTLLDEQGQLRRFVKVFVDRRDIQSSGGLATPIAGAEALTILPAVAGGLR